MSHLGIVIFDRFRSVFNTSCVLVPWGAMLASHVTISCMVREALSSPFTLRVYLQAPSRRASGCNPDLLWLGFGFTQS